MNQREIFDILTEAINATEARRDEIWDMLQAEARGHADQLVLVDKVRLDGILELLEQAYRETAEHIPAALPSFIKLFHAVCGDERPAGSLWDKSFVWSALRMVGRTASTKIG